MKKAVFLDYDSLQPADLDSSGLLQLNNHGIELVLHNHTSAEQTLARLQGAHIAITNKVVINANILAACPSLELIAVTATGTNNIDRQAAQERGVQIANVHGYGTHAVAQHTLALLLMLANRLQAATQDAINGRWSQSAQFCLMDYPIKDLHGATLGLIGYGELGQAVAQLARAFGMRVIVAEGVNGPQHGRLPLRTVLQQADVISLHTLLTPATEKIINTDTLSLMKKGALLINTARGGLIDEAALKAALVSGYLGGAALDVLSVEPPPPDHLLLNPNIPNLLITPHCAWISPGARQRLLNTTVENILRFIQR